MPKILQGCLENNDGSTVDVSNLLVSPELILNIDLVENDQLSNLLKEKKGFFVRLDMNTKRLVAGIKNSLR